MGVTVFRGEIGLVCAIICVHSPIKTLKTCRTCRSFVFYGYGCSLLGYIHIIQFGLNSPNRYNHNLLIKKDLICFFDLE